MNSKFRSLVGLHLFNGITAVAGGFALMAGVIDSQANAWLGHTAFNGLYFPGIILFAIVGGSSLFAALCLLKRTNESTSLSLLAGLIMLFWIIGEVVSIRTFHFLQVIYVITSLSVIYLTFQTKSKK